MVIKNQKKKLTFYFSNLKNNDYIVMEHITCQLFFFSSTK